MNRVWNIVFTFCAQLNFSNNTNCVHVRASPNESKVFAFLSSVSKCSKFYLKQESPPAWTQEAYRPRRIKYSICYPVRGGVPPPVGVPPLPGPMWGGVPEVWYPPIGVPPWPGLMGGGTWGGVPPGLAGPGRGTPIPPPPAQVWTDKQSETITFPLVYVRGR